MKRLWAAVVILAVLLGTALWNAWYARTFTGELIQRLERAQVLAVQDRWEEASQLSQEAFQSWRDHDFYLHVFMRHSDTDQILGSFRALEQYLALEEPDQYNAANAQLMTQLELLSEMEQPSLTNIL